MRLENRIKHNKVIALYMAYESKFGLAWANPAEKNVRDLKRVPLNDAELRDMKYNSDWNWLMTVVKKVTDHHNNYTYFHIGYLYDDLKCALYNVNIEEAYKLVVKCINWYNSQETQEYLK